MTQLLQRLYYGFGVFLLAILLASESLYGAGNGGDVVNNGGGLAEKNFTYAFQNLGHFLENSLDFFGGSLTEKENRVLRRISQEVSGKNPAGGVIFKSGLLEPGFFEVDEHGKTRVAVTSSQPGSPIYVNLDLIYPVKDGVKTALSVLEAVGILVHEIGHHQGEKDHLFLDKLGSKVQASREPYLESIDLQKYKQEKFIIRSYNYSFNIQEYPAFDSAYQGRLVLENGFDLVDFTPMIVPLTECPAEMRVVGYYFANMHWQKLAAFNVSENTQEIVVSMDMDYRCRPERSGILDFPTFSKALSIRGSFKVEIESQGKLRPPNFEGKQWIYYPESILTPIPETFKFDLQDSP